MTSYHVTSIRHAVAAAALLALLSMPAADAVAGDPGEAAYEHAGKHHDARVRRIRGIAVTGVNSVLGEPIFSWGEPFGASFNFPTLAAFNANGPEPIALDADTPESAIVATYIDRDFLDLFNKPPDYVLNPQWLNVPLRDVPVNVDFAMGMTAPLHGAGEAEPLELSQAEPANDITLGQWLKGGGTATIRCSRDAGEVQLRMRRLIPNRMYSVWATMGLPPQPGQSTPAAFPIPLGGAPNTFMTDENGAGSFKRWIKFCPLDRESAGSPLLFIDVQFNSKHQTYGAVVAPGFIDGNWPGIITFSHVVFPVNVELLDRQGT